MLEQRLKINAPTKDPRTATTLLEVTLRQEFAICGQIVEACQKDKLPCTNLINQIECGQRKGHSETEIIEAVIKGSKSRPPPKGDA